MSSIGDLIVHYLTAALGDISDDDGIQDEMYDIKNVVDGMAISIVRLLDEVAALEKRVKELEKKESEE